jgi:hypothetical protein
LIHSSIVGIFVPDQHLGDFLPRERLQSDVQVPWTELARSTRRLSEFS